MLVKILKDCYCVEIKETTSFRKAVDALTLGGTLSDVWIGDDLI